MPPAVYILMALEAARQMSLATGSDKCCARLIKVYFDDPLPLDHFLTPNTTVEMHLSARQLEEQDTFEFDIFSKSYQQSSLRRCHGIFSWSVSSPHSTNLNLDIRPDLFLLKVARTIFRTSEKTDFPKLSDLALSEEGSCGVFLDGQECHENYCIDPVVLSSILMLTPLSGVRRNLPTCQKLVSIGAASAPLTPAQGLSGSFKSSYHPLEPYRAQCNVEIPLHDTFLTFSDMIYEPERSINVPSQPESLLFKPVLLPDITELEITQTLPLEWLVTLLTHKWPMTDIAVTGLPSELCNRISHELEHPYHGTRRRFRSLTLLDDLQKNLSIDDQQVNPSAASQLHLLFLGNADRLSVMVKYVQPDGFLCIPTSITHEITKLELSLKKNCYVEGIDHDKWVLYRLQDRSKPHPCDRNVATYTSEHDKRFHPDVFDDGESIVFERDVESPLPHTVKPKRIDAVIIDTVETAVLTKWPGSKLIPWLRTLLRSARSLLWVTIDDSGSCWGSGSPFTNIAGSLLRTLQAEQPSLQVSWLRFSNARLLSDSAIQGHILSAYNAMLAGDNEVLREVKDGRVNVLRYIPDDELSAAVGAILPQPVPGLGTGKSYEVSLAAVRKPVILTRHRQRRESIHTNDSFVEVDVEASVLNPSDIAACSGDRPSFGCTGWIEHDMYQSNHRRGMFFAGRILSETNKAFPNGSRVVGWHSGAHSGHLYVSSKQLQLYNDEEDGPYSAAKAAAQFGALAIALCIVNGAIRARKNDVIHITYDGILKEATTRECEKVGATVLEVDDVKLANFSVTIDRTGSICVNGKQIDLISYLKSDHGLSAISQAWTTCSTYEADVSMYTLADLEGAFQRSEKAPFSTVITHRGLDQVKTSVPTYRKPSKLFSTAGAYVVVGGLGGLGRFVCAWMVENGAKTIYAISRSGLGSKEAQEAHAAINESGALFVVLKADACDQKAMADALGRIRESHPIVGVMNMAMLLGDAPFMDMTVGSREFYRIFTMADLFVG